MPAVYVSRISQWIEKRFNAKGGNVITDIDPTASTQLQFASGVEDRYLQGWNRFAGAVEVTGGAAQFSATQLRNPAGSNVIAVIEKMTVANLTSASTAYGYGQGLKSTDLTTISTAPFRLDTRGNPLPAMILSFTTNNTNPTTTQLQGATAAVASPYEFIQTANQELPLLPGDSALLFTFTAAADILFSWMWRERALELSELT